MNNLLVFSHKDNIPFDKVALKLDENKKRELKLVFKNKIIVNFYYYSYLHPDSSHKKGCENRTLFNYLLRMAI